MTSDRDSDATVQQHHAACSCGQLSLIAQGEPVRVSICHCYACQRRTGGPFGEQARFARKHVNTRGEAREYIRVADSGKRLRYYFCPHCGSTVCYLHEEEPELIAVPVGAFANRHFVAPRFSVYESRKHAWVEPPTAAERSD